MELLGRPTSCEVREIRLHAAVDHVAFGELVRAEEQDGSRERPQQGRKPTTVEPPPHAFLPQDGIVRRAEGGIFGGDMRVALLPRLDRIQGVHEHVASGSPEASGDHGLEETISISIFSTTQPRQPASDRSQGWRVRRRFSYM